MATAFYRKIKSKKLDLGKVHYANIQGNVEFFQDEILGMRWFNRVVGSLIEVCGLNPESRIGGSIQFFIYDIVNDTEKFRLYVEGEMIE